MFLWAMREKLPSINEGKETKLWNKINLFLIVHFCTSGLWHREDQQGLEKTKERAHGIL